MTEPQRWPFSEVLATARGPALCPHGVGGLIPLVRYMTRGWVNPPLFHAALHACSHSILQQYPWLVNCNPPSWVVNADSNVFVWCWLDSEEQKYSGQFPDGYPLTPLIAHEWDPHVMLNSGTGTSILPISALSPEVQEQIARQFRGEDLG